MGWTNRLTADQNNLAQGCSYFFCFRPHHKSTLLLWSMRRPTFAWYFEDMDHKENRPYQEILGTKLTCQKMLWTCAFNTCFRI